MHWLFLLLLIAGILLVIWPFFAPVTATAAIILWILGALCIIAAFFALPAWWARPAAPAAGPGEPGARYGSPTMPASRGEAHPENPPNEPPPPGEKRI